MSFGDCSFTLRYFSWGGPRRPPPVPHSSFLIPCILGLRATKSIWEVFQGRREPLEICFKGDKKHLGGVSRVAKSIWDVFWGSQKVFGKCFKDHDKHLGSASRVIKNIGEMFQGYLEGSLRMMKSIWEVVGGWKKVFGMCLWISFFISPRRDDHRLLAI